MALMRQDMKYMREDITEIKNDFRASIGLYMSKEQAMVMTDTWDKKYQALEKRISSIYAYGGSILVILTTAVIGAILKLILKV